MNARRFIATVDGANAEVVLAVDYDKLETLCVDFTRAVGTALIEINERPTGAGPYFSDGPDFKGWAERSGDGWECKSCGNWHAPRTLRCLNNKCPSYASQREVSK